MYSNKSRLLAPLGVRGLSCGFSPPRIAAIPNLARWIGWPNCLGPRLRCPSTVVGRDCTPKPGSCTAPLASAQPMWVPPTYRVPPWPAAWNGRSSSPKQGTRRSLSEPRPTLRRSGMTRSSSPTTRTTPSKWRPSSGHSRRSGATITTRRSPGLESNPNPTRSTPRPAGSRTPARPQT